jgi:hypothetical protein
MTADMESVENALIKILAAIVGVRAIDSRRREVQKTVLSAGLTDTELTELGPYVQLTVEHGRVERRLLLAAGGLSCAGMALGGIVTGSSGGGVLLLLSGVIGGILYIGPYRAYHDARRIEQILSENPRYFLGPEYDGQYDTFLRHLDYDPERYASYSDTDLRADQE